MSTVKHVLMENTTMMAEQLEVAFEKAAQVIKEREAIADVVLAGLTPDAIAIAKKVKEAYALDATDLLPLYVIACEGIALGRAS